MVAANDTRGPGGALYLGRDDFQVLSLDDLRMNTRRIRLIVRINRLEIDLDALRRYVLHRSSEIAAAFLAHIYVRVRLLYPTTGADNAR